MNKEEVLMKIFGGVTQGRAIDVGAHDGVFMSTTKAFEDLGWWVLCIEPNPLLIPALLENRKLVVQAACGLENGTALLSVNKSRSQGMASFTSTQYKLGGRDSAEFHVPVQVYTLTTLLETIGVPNIDLLCIDAEGEEPEVLQGIDLERWTPKAICVEDNKNFGYVGYLAKYGYEPVVSVQNDFIFAKEVPE